ncbi:hypothetical protein EW145_g4108 [Phellinidium pouzarii]|uniref:Carbohydrate-binding module family 19 domain-containing protein n=1 Tax=Phellinidium pouzarii TaxID=167371 RepID=A0A4S4L4Y2_9AGAM|nr:hypothetical protein EW145_g4108 [Phellinidium pouzarii]
MVHFKSLLAFVITATTVSAIPLHKRIAQTIADSTTAWEQACTTAGGAGQCNPISQQAFTSLLAAGGNCDQQNAADAMVSLAKQLNNNADMIRLAQIFVQQPRNAPDSLQVPYCQTAPNNTELNGFFHCQFASSDFTKFSGDQTGNLPLGLNAVTPPGSCPAQTTGPVPDGVQLNTLVQSPGTPEGGDAGSAAPPPAANVTTSVASVASVAPAVSSPAVSSVAGATSSVAPTAATAASPAASAPADAKSFTLQNGLDAQQGNAQAATLTADSACTDGETVCAGTQFGQCVGGKLVLTSCSGGTQCFVLPLVDKAGTSEACTTESDAASRIAATGATGGITGAQ